MNRRERRLLKKKYGEFLPGSFSKIPKRCPCCGGKLKYGGVMSKEEVEALEASGKVEWLGEDVFVIRESKESK